MAWRNSIDRWGGVSQLLHWLVVALVVVQVVLASIAEDLPLGMQKLAMLARHKSVGITILALMLLRLAWRWLNPVPALPAGMPGWQRALARGTHWGFYAILLAMPLSGWAMSSARNFPVSWFGLFQLPDFVAPSESIYRAAVNAHRWLALLLLVTIALHVAAVLYHQFVRRDRLLRRMLPTATALLLALCGTVVATSREAVAGAPATVAGAPRSYTSDAARSSLRFVFVQAGARTEGRFQRFAVELQLGPQGGRAPNVVGLTVEIDVASVDSRDAERDAILRGPDLFHVERFPRARFVATSATPRAGVADGVLLRGTLSIRDASRPVSIPATLRSVTEGGRRVFRLDGEVAIRRLDFGVGQGEWKSTEWVADEVRVPFSVVLGPAGDRRLTSQIASHESAKPGTSSYMAKAPPSEAPCFHRMTVAPPTTMPASAPARVIRCQYSDSISAGPKAAPNPAQAQATRSSTRLSGFSASRKASTLMASTAQRPVHSSSRRPARGRRKAR